MEIKSLYVQLESKTEFNSNNFNDFTKNDKNNEIKVMVTNIVILMRYYTQPKYYSRTDFGRLIGKFDTILIKCV